MESGQFEIAEHEGAERLSGVEILKVVASSNAIGKRGLQHA